jgi:ribonuclease Z
MTPAGPANRFDSIMRIFAGLVGLILLVIGIGFFTMPEVLATGFYVEPARAVGINTIRGDFGAMFLGMGFFCLVGALTRYRKLLFVPIVFLALVLIGRITGLIVDDTPNVVSDAIGSEFVFVVVLIMSLAAYSRSRPADDPPLTMKNIFTRRVLVGMVVVLVAIGAVFLSQRKIGLAMVEKIAGQYVSTDIVAELPDGLHIGLNGTGAPLPDAKRACSGLFVIAGKNIFIVDAGPGSIRRFELMKLKTGHIQAAFLTHFHSDHIGDLGELMLRRWAGGANSEPLDVFGPEGVENVVRGFNMAYSLDSGYRVAHHGASTTPPTGAGGIGRPFTFPDGQQSVIVFEQDGLKVTAFPVAHPPIEPSVGYRFDYKGRSLVISGDTLPMDPLRQQARGVDLLLHEGLAPDMVRMLSHVNRINGQANTAAIINDILDYHTFPEEAARIAAEADVGHLVFYHIIPPLPVAFLKAAFLGDSKKYFHGPITVAVDGMLFSLPAGGKDIQKKWLM